MELRFDAVHALARRADLRSHSFAEEVVKSLLVLRNHPRQLGELGVGVEETLGGALLEPIKARIGPRLGNLEPTQPLIRDAVERLQVGANPVQGLENQVRRGQLFGRHAEDVSAGAPDIHPAAARAMTIAVAITVTWGLTPSAEGNTEASAM
ncbi:MAG: hypothetical protein HYZ28_09670 [Myxococcales bacterium]|nr:hypothetical protein [Myxococcales bacterium]